MKTILSSVRDAYNNGRRMVVPLVGLPGLNLTGCSLKIAQQNYIEQVKVLKAIADTYKPDAVFPLMDLSVEANALGKYTLFPKDESATVLPETFNAEDFEKTKKINFASDTRLLGYTETVKLMSSRLNKDVLKGAYVTGPYTLAALLMGSSEAAAASIERPEELTEICEFTTEKITEYIILLIAAGAQIICILEPTAVMLGPEQFDLFSARYIKRICGNNKLSGISVVYHVCGNSMHLIDKMTKSGVDAISLDSPAAGVVLSAAAERVPDNVVIIGNVNPTGAILHGTPRDVTGEVLKLLQSMDNYPNFILSTGCDLPREVPDENIKAFMNAGRNYIIN